MKVLRVVKPLLGSFWILLLAAGLTGKVFADGIIVIDRPKPVPPPGPVVMRTIPLAIRRHHVKINIQGAVAATEVDQVFHNPNPMALEGTYIFPIPKGAAMGRFTMLIDGKEVKAELLDAAKARQIYEDIVRRKKDPALLEYYGRSMLRARVYPIPARGDTQVKITYNEVLKPDAALVGYRYPLNTEKFSSEPIKSVSVHVTLDALRPLSTIYSPSHKVQVLRRGPNKATVSYEQTNVKPDQDFLLYYLLKESEVGMHVMSYADGAEDGTLLLMIAPGLRDGGKAIPKDIVFVIDTSGSMRGKKIEQARRALAFCLNGLNGNDRFNLISFSTESRPFADGLLKAEAKEVNRALKHIEKLEAAGGTNLHEALLGALKRESGSERPFIVVFLTDGLPTVGKTNEKDILRDAKSANKAGARIFTFGVGHDVNTHLLDGLIEEHRGASEYVAPNEDIEVKVSKFYTKISSPVMTGLELKIAGAQTHDLYPKALGDLFRGSELLVLARYKGAGEARVTLSGLYGDEKKTFAYKAQLPQKDKRCDFLPRLWAMRKVGYLLRQIRLHGESSELKDEVVALAKRYGLLTPYTSMLIIEDEARVRVAGGRLMDKNALDAIAAPAMEGMRAKSGAAAFKTARRQSRMLRATAAPQAVQEEMHVEGRRAIRQLKRNVGPYTFYLRKGVWVDSRFAEGSKAEKVAFLSERFFELVRRAPDLAGAFALGQRVVVVIDGRPYEIVKG